MLALSEVATVLVLLHRMVRMAAKKNPVTCPAFNTVFTITYKEFCDQMCAVRIFGGVYLE